MFEQLFIGILFLFFVPSYYFDRRDMEDDEQFREARAHARRQFWCV